jgi:putative MATE family efflux protein
MSKASLLEGEVAPHLRRLSVPLALGLFSLTFSNIADIWFIGRLGTEYLAAFGFVLPIVMLFMGVIFGLSIGTVSALSRVYGSGDIEKLRQMSTDAVSLTLIMVTAAAVAGFFLIDPVFRWMGAGEVVMPLIHGFMSIWYCGLPFLGMMMIGNACIRATGDTRFPSAMMTANATGSVVLCPFFVFGIWFFPEMKLSGAAMAQVITAVCTATFSFYKLTAVKKILSEKVFHTGVFESWKKIFHVAVPSMISNQIAPISLAVITAMAATFGREAVAALGVANRIEGLVMIFFYSMNAGTSIFVGQNHGAGNFGRIREALAIGTRLAFAWGFFCAGVMWFLSGVLPPFFDSNPDVVGFAKQYLHWVPISYAALGTMILANGIFNSIGRPLPSMLIIFMKAVVLYIPMAWWLKGIFGFTGILMALMLTNIMVGVISFFWSRKAIS